MRKVATKVGKFLLFSQLYAPIKTGVTYHHTILRQSLLPPTSAAANKRFDPSYTSVDKKTEHRQTTRTTAPSHDIASIGEIAPGCMYAAPLPQVWPGVIRFSIAPIVVIAPGVRKYQERHALIVFARPHRGFGNHQGYRTGVRQKTQDIYSKNAFATGAITRMITVDTCRVGPYRSLRKSEHRRGV